MCTPTGDEGAFVPARAQDEGASDTDGIPVLGVGAGAGAALMAATMVDLRVCEDDVTARVVALGSLTWQYHYVQVHRLGDLGTEAQQYEELTHGSVAIGAAQMGELLQQLLHVPVQQLAQQSPASPPPSQDEWPI
jgi:hypothetical protein